jgi:hypothetical protein
MRRDALAAAGGAGLRGGGAVLGQPRRHAIPAERPTASVGKHGRFRATRLCTRPRASRGERVLAPGEAPHLAPLAVTAHVRTRAPGDVVPAEPAHRCDAAAGLGRPQQERPGTPTGPWLLIRRREERVALGTGPKGDRRAVIARTGEGSGALAQATGAWRVPRRVVAKGVKRGQAPIAATSAEAALGLQSIENRPDPRRLQRGPRQRRGHLVPPWLRTASPPAAGVAVAGHRVGTGPLWAQEPLGKAGFQHARTGERRRPDGSLLRVWSRRWVAKPSHAGVALRSQ